MATLACYELGNAQGEPLMKARSTALFSLAASTLLSYPFIVRADVVILANRTDKDVRFTIHTAEDKSSEHTLSSNSLVPFPATGLLKLDFQSGKTEKHYHLAPNTAHYFGDTPAGIDLAQLGLGEEASDKGNEPNNPRPQQSRITAVFPLTIRVKILVDDEEPAVQKTWEQRLRKRLEAASEILEQQCRVKLKVTAVDTWQSDNSLNTFKDLLRDFEKKVKPDPADLAIGFMSQRCEDDNGTRHLGGTRFSFYPQILIREYMPRSEPERLEVLLHELGHHLGATHSAEADSVMRPKLGDGKSPAKAFRIGFDPANALIMNLVVEARARGAKSPSDIDANTRLRLCQIYGEIGRTMPQDQSTATYIRVLKGEPLQGMGQVKASSVVVEATRKVMDAIVKAAESNRRLPSRPEKKSEGKFRLEGDALTEFYIHAAALVAKDMPKQYASSAFLLGIGLAIDDSTIISDNPLTRDMCKQIENAEERQHRVEVLGSPTMAGRRDSCQHFVVSCALTAMFGPKLAESAGILKEQMDMRPGGSGFSFADLAADFSGVEFASLVKASDAVLAKVAESFIVKDYMVPMKDWEDDLPKSKFTKDYGSVTDERFLRMKEAIYKKVHELPGHEKKGK
jgi:hypothetical protein